MAEHVLLVTRDAHGDWVADDTAALEGSEDVLTVEDFGPVGEAQKAVVHLPGDRVTHLLSVRASLDFPDAGYVLRSDLAASKVRP